MKAIIATLLLCLSTVAFSAVVATQPNQAGGKIVLTDEQCKYGGKTYDPLKRAYNYGNDGLTSEGCWYLEDEAIVVIWKNSDNSSTTRRYPVTNFEIKKRINL